jgi:GT2 family glycosyltransferase
MQSSTVNLSSAVQSPSVSIVILNWNGKTFLKTYLSKVEQYSRLPGVRIIVADNASTDNSLAYLQMHHPGIEVIRLDRNYGFAEGYNRALQQVQSDYYVLLNSDAEVTENWLQPMLDVMRRKPDVAACMPKILSAAEPEMFEYAGAAGGFMDKYGYMFCRGRLFHTLEKDTGQYDSESEIFWVTGACCMIRAKLFHEMGGFDGFFFAHMEEIDLCWRLKNAGYVIWYTPKSKVYHVGGGTLPQQSPYKTFLNYRNNLLMMYKNLPEKHRNRTLFLRIVMDWISAANSLLHGDTTVLRAVLQAHGAYRKALPEYRKYRKKPVSFPSCVYHRSVVYQYFIKGIRKFGQLKNDSRPAC